MAKSKADRMRAALNVEAGNLRFEGKPEVADKLKALMKDMPDESLERLFDILSD